MRKLSRCIQGPYAECGRRAPIAEQLLAFESRVLDKVPAIRAGMGAKALDSFQGANLKWATPTQANQGTRWQMTKGV